MTITAESRLRRSLVARLVKSGSVEVQYGSPAHLILDGMADDGRAKLVRLTYFDSIAEYGRATDGTEQTE